MWIHPKAIYIVNRLRFLVFVLWDSRATKTFSLVEILAPHHPRVLVQFFSRRQSFKRFFEPYAYAACIRIRVKCQPFIRTFHTVVYFGKWTCDESRGHSFGYIHIRDLSWKTDDGWIPNGMTERWLWFRPPLPIGLLSNHVDRSCSVINVPELIYTLRDTVARLAQIGDPDLLNGIINAL